MFFRKINHETEIIIQNKTKTSNCFLPDLTEMQYKKIKIRGKVIAFSLVRSAHIKNKKWNIKK